MMSDFVLEPDLLDEYDPREDMVCWANKSEPRLKEYGYGFDPPEEIFDYPDLLERGCGWDRLVTSAASPDNMPSYKKYLKDYYSHNTAESVARQAWLNERDDDANDDTASNGTGIGTGLLLATLAKLCIEAEEKFLYKRRMSKLADFTSDDINLSKKIQEGVHRIMCLEGEFPVAATAFMIITNKAELMCEWLDLGTYHPADNEWCITVNIVRRCALDFMAYKGLESFSVAGLLMGIAKETKTLCEAIRQDPCGSRKCSSSTAILLDGWDVLEIIHDEFFPAASQDGAISKINIVGELTSNTIEEDVQNVESEDEMPKQPIGQKTTKFVSKKEKVGERRAARAPKCKSKAMRDDGKLKEFAIDVEKLDKLSKVQEEANPNRMKVLELQQKMSSDKIETWRLAHLTAQENRESKKLELEGKRLEMESKKIEMEGKKLEKESKMMEAYNNLISQDTSSMIDDEKVERVAAMKCLRKMLFSEVI